MKVYKDVISGDELFSDSYPVKVIDDVVYEVEGKFVNKVEGGDYGIGGEEGETFDAQQVRVINVVDASRLQQTSFDKKSYMAHIKAYMKAVKEKLDQDNPSRVAAFQTGAQNYVKKMLGNFDEYQFYTGESMNPDGSVVLLFYRPDGITPVFHVWKDGVIEEKF